MTGTSCQITDRLAGRPRLLAGGLVLSVLMTPITHAATAFQLNFNNQIPVSLATCGPTSDCTVRGGDRLLAGSSVSGNDGTRFIQEQLYIGNDLFFHVVVGDPATGFASESYTRSSQAAAANVSTALLGGAPNPFSPDSGGNEIGVGTNAINRTNLPDSRTLFGNARAPLDPRSNLTGSGTGDPSRTVLRVSVSDGEMSQEVSKPVLDRKPRISQLTTDNAGMVGEFVADMRSVSYREKNKTIPITNRLHIDDPTLPSPGSADFDMSMVQRSSVTAGKYDYTVGAGWNTADGWTAPGAVFTPGTYSGEGAGFDPLTTNWATFFSQTQNATACNFPNSTRQLLGICP